MTKKIEYGRIAETLSTNEMCTILGIGPRSLRDLSSRGKITQSPQKGRYFTHSIASYCTHLREVAASRVTESGLSLMDERAKSEQIARQIAEIKLKQARAETIDASEVAEAWGKLSRALSVMVMGIASKARGRIPHLTAHDAETLKELCRETLDIMAENLEDGAVIGAEPESLRRA